MRYLYLAYGINPYPANGSQVVWNYSGTKLSKVANGTANKAPKAGDVISYGATNTWGHTAVVIGSNVNSSGNGSITILNQNYGGNAVQTSSVSNWIVASLGGLGATGWLTSNTPPAPPTWPWDFETLDGATGTLGNHNTDNGYTPTAIEFNGAYHTFYADATTGDLRHGWFTHGVGWAFEVLDGAGGSYGRVNANVGYQPTAVIYQNSLHLFYYDATNASLRHGWFTHGVGWRFEYIDGKNSSFSGRLTSDVGKSNAVTVSTIDGSLQLFYPDSTYGNLRHAWHNGSGWHLENLDGSPNSVTGTEANLGQDPAVTMHNNSMRLFYYDTTNGNLKYAKYSASSGWQFQTLDGSSASVGGYNANVGQTPAAISYNSALHMFYYDATNGDLRHAFEDAGGWHFETLDGKTGSFGNYNANVGHTSSIAILNGAIHIFYYDTTGGNMRHAWWHSTSGWGFEQLDGTGGQPATRLNANVGLDPHAIIFNNVIHLLYQDGSNGNLRHAWTK